MGLQKSNGRVAQDRCGSTPASGEGLHALPAPLPGAALHMPLRAHYRAVARSTSQDSPLLRFPHLLLPVSHNLWPAPLPFTIGTAIVNVLSFACPHHQSVRTCRLQWHPFILVGYTALLLKPPPLLLQWWGAAVATWGAVKDAGGSCHGHAQTSRIPRLLDAAGPPFTHLLHDIDHRPQRAALQLVQLWLQLALQVKVGLLRRNAREQLLAGAGGGMGDASYSTAALHHNPWPVTSQTKQLPHARARCRRGGPKGTVSCCCPYTPLQPCC
jgi:hypothetical protein